MALDAAYSKLLELQLDECDAALEGKPNLASIFDPAWRATHRAKMLGTQSRNDVWYPRSYAKPQNDMCYPADWQDRLEEGADVLLPILDAGERSHLINRIRGNGCLSAEEELLLARGFANTFGRDAITFPAVRRGQDVPEFHVRVGTRLIEVEAKGLTDEKEVRDLNEYAVRTGQMSWCSSSPTIGDLGRLRAAVAKKLLSTATADGRVLLLTQYTPWIDPSEAIPLIRTMATAPASFNIGVEKHPLAVAYVTARWIAGVWFNDCVAARLGVDIASREQVRTAVRNSFYPRTSGVFFDESNTELREQELIAEMIRVAFGG